MGWFETTEYDVDLARVETPWESLSPLEKNMTAVFQVAHKLVVTNPNTVMPIVEACREVFKRDEPEIEKQCHVLWLQYSLAKPRMSGWDKVAFFARASRHPGVLWRAR